jgi:hypothetical protein
VHLTLPLSGREGVWGGAAESNWWPVHSRGWLDSNLDETLNQFLVNQAKNPTAQDKKSL